MILVEPALSNFVFLAKLSGGMTFLLAVISLSAVASGNDVSMWKAMNARMNAMEAEITQLKAAVASQNDVVSC